MKLKSISINNFRQFHDEININFATGKDKNITVIHGANGAGKTSLLNAFKWCFYGKTDFDTSTDNILNELAIQNVEIGQEIELKISVIFDESNCSYEATRKVKYRKINDMQIKAGDIEFTIMKRDAKTGISKLVDAPHSEINRILPETLQPYFFFNGERIEKLAGVNESDQIKEAIKKLMGLKQLERAQRHLDKVSKKFRKDVAALQSQDDQNLLKEIEKLELNIEDSDALLERKEDEYEKIEEKLKKFDNILVNFQEAKSLQNRRAELNSFNKEIGEELTNILQKRKDLIDKFRSVLLAKPIIEQCKSLVEENRKKGIIPYKIRATFIDDLITEEKCICGRFLDENSKQVLLEARKKAGNDDLETIYLAVSTYISSYEENVKSYHEQAAELSNRFKNLSENQEKNNSEISEISLKLQGIDNKEISEIERKRNNLENEKIDILCAIRESKNSISKFSEELREKKKEWSIISTKQTHHDQASNRLKSSENIYRALVEINNSMTEKVRVDLSEKVSETFNGIIRKNMNAYIDDNFLLRVEKISSEGNYEAKEQSTGEKQVTSLSFIASIISLAKERHNKGETKFFRGGLYPLVMDSPFGALDDDYRLKVAENISILADQVIMFVSNSQWRGNVKKACEQRVGCCYKLVHYSNSSAAEHNQSDVLRYTENTSEYSIIEESEI